MGKTRWSGVAVAGRRRRRGGEARRGEARHYGALDDRCHEPTQTRFRCRTTSTRDERTGTSQVPRNLTGTTGTSDHQQPRTTTTTTTTTTSNNNNNNNNNTKNLRDDVC